MTDRELLELAAKAAGIEHVTPMMLEWGKWNPLTDDGDALRMAVAMGMVVDTLNARAAFAKDFIDGQADRWLDGGGCARRAIVRAAADLGRNMLSSKP